MAPITINVQSRSGAPIAKLTVDGSVSVVWARGEREGESGRERARALMSRTHTSRPPRIPSLHPHA
jgi:hypothetical protein